MIDITFIKTWNSKKDFRNKIKFLRKWSENKIFQNIYFERLLKGFIKRINRNSLKMGYKNNQSYFRNELSGYNQNPPEVWTWQNTPVSFVVRYTPLDFSPIG